MDQDDPTGEADLNLLELFAAVVEAGSISEASRRAGAPKSTISRGITRLETSLGIHLLDRSSQRVVPTRAGEHLYQRITPQLAAIRRSLTALDRDSELAGDLRLAAPIDFGTHPMPGLLTRFARKYPEIRVELVLTNDVADLSTHGIDLALRVRIQDLDREALHGTRVGRFAMRLYASPEYLDRRGVPRTPEDLGGHDWVAGRGAREFRLQGPGGPTAVPVRPSIVANEANFLREAVCLGAGIGALATNATATDVARGRLVAILPEWQLPDGQVWLVWPSRPQTPARVLVLRDFVRDELRPLLG